MVHMHEQVGAFLGSNWSENLSRNITNINIAHDIDFKRNLLQLKEQGFSVNKIESGNKFNSDC